MFTEFTEIRKKYLDEHPEINQSPESKRIVKRDLIIVILIGLVLLLSYFLMHHIRIEIKEI